MSMDPYLPIKTIEIVYGEMRCAARRFLAVYILVQKKAAYQNRDMILALELHQSA